MHSHHTHHSYDYIFRLKSIFPLRKKTLTLRKKKILNNKQKIVTFQNILNILKHTLHNYFQVNVTSKLENILKSSQRQHELTDRRRVGGRASGNIRIMCRDGGSSTHVMWHGGGVVSDSWRGGGPVVRTLCFSARRMVLMSWERCLTGHMGGRGWGVVHRSVR